MSVLRPWRCTYWEVYHYLKMVRTCPPHLRHMIPQATAYIAKRALFWHPTFLIAGLRLFGMRPFERIFKWGRPYYRRIVGTELAAFRAWLRPRRRINAFLGWELFRRPVVMS